MTERKTGWGGMRVALFKGGYDDNKIKFKKKKKKKKSEQMTEKKTGLGWDGGGSIQRWI